MGDEPITSHKLNVAVIAVFSSRKKVVSTATSPLTQRHYIATKALYPALIRFREMRNGEGDVVLPHTPASEAPSYNIFRDSLVRYLGYTNEIGESFRYQFPRLVRPSYIVAFSYRGADALTTGYRAWSEANRTNRHPLNDTHPSNPYVREYKAGVATFDTLLWQTFASVMLPGVTINMIVKASRFAVARTTVLHHLVSKWLPTSIGIISIPFIVEPIDAFVDFSLDNTTRSWLNTRRSRGDNDCDSKGS